MSLTKIPFLLSATVGIHITMTPPNSAAKSAPSSRVPPRGFERLAPLFPRIAKVGPPRRPCWLLVLRARRNRAHRRAPRLPVLKILPLGCPPPPHARSPRARCPPHAHAPLPPRMAAQPRWHVPPHRVLPPPAQPLHLRARHPRLTIPLITSGPYAIVRHPSYSGALLAALGVALCHLSPGTWLVWAVGASVICAALTSRIRKEDAMLQKNFGREWDEWAARVPYKIIPGLY
ncbi:hypothetical protein C8J57DRAFT_1532523 [Mycena rebaudengoi]|nr:hypothetical protein C8J57DRAFT_1532523 [Mycena rebaudengoi]